MGTRRAHSVTHKGIAPLHYYVRGNGSAAPALGEVVAWRGQRRHHSTTEHSPHRHSSHFGQTTGFDPTHLEGWAHAGGCSTTIPHK